ncbi:cell division septation protein DedD [Halarchaeum rubridurum]|nr:LamG domain-containing protein [Halarchaeum rubridurum]MBP1953474.1 cell division septation protein DedD [Halarchaeum rubridurum]
MNGDREPVDGLTRRDWLKLAGVAAVTPLAGPATGSASAAPLDAEAVAYGYGGGAVRISPALLAGLGDATAAVSLPAPVAHWTLDEERGRVVRDAAGDTDGTLVGNPVLGVAGPRGAGALNCRRRDGHYATVPHDPALVPREALTLSAWFRTSADDTEQTLVQKATDHVRGSGYVLDVQANRAFRAKLGVESGRAFVNPWRDFDAHDGAWHHLLVTWDGDALVLYYDGAEVGRDESQSGSVVGDDSPLHIGHGHNAWTTVYDIAGSVDDVRLYDVALDAEAVRALYEGTSTVDDGGESTTTTTTTTTTTSTPTTTTPTTTTPTTTTTSTTTTPTTTPTTTTTTPTTTTTTAAEPTTTTSTADDEYGNQGYGAGGYGGVPTQS